MVVQIRQGHVLEVLAGLPAKSVHVCVTSPPYWGLRAYGTPPQDWGDGWTGELGSEPTLDAFVRHLVEVFAAVKRVMRDDGTLWVNLGDSYVGTSGNQNGEGLDGARRGGAAGMFAAAEGTSTKRVDDLAQGNLCMAPARFALAMQAAGWTLRSELTLCKTAPMPESVSGSRWERCRVSLKPAARAKDGRGGANPAHEQRPGNFRNETEATQGTMAEWADCPGCPKCAATEGYVQRWGSGRPTSATEKLFLFSKAGAKYFYDVEAVRVALKPGADHDRPRGMVGENHGVSSKGSLIETRPEMRSNPAGRNLWNYVMWSPEPSSFQHYAAFPRWLPRLAIRAGTSERGVCPGCGAPWLRVVERGTPHLDPRVWSAAGQRHYDDRAGGVVERSPADGSTLKHVRENATLGWRPSCACPPHDPAPAVCLDPFAGSGTTLIEANALGRHGWGIELQAKYVAIAHQRLSRQPLSLFAHEGAAALGGEAAGD